MRVLQALPLGKLTEFRFLLQQLEGLGLFNLSEARQAVVNEESRRHSEEKQVRRRKVLEGSVRIKHSPLRICSVCGAPMSMERIDEEGIVIASCLDKSCWFSEIVPAEELASIKKKGLRIQ